MLDFKKRSKQKETESKAADGVLSLALKLDNLIHRESAISPKTPGGGSLPLPLSPTYTDNDLSPRSKLREKAAFHKTDLPDNCFENRTPELARRQLNAAVYANSKHGSKEEWVETYGSDERFPGNRVKPS